MNFNSSADLLCMGCMSSNGNDRVCSLCGFDESNYLSLPNHLPLRTILNGKYLVGRVLGEGGFGITYIGWDLNLDLKIAIKEYYPTGFVTRENASTNTVMPYIGEKTQIFQSGRDKFVCEAKRLAKFHSLPGIVSIKDFFLENGTAYIVMEYVEGETLKQYLTRMGGKISANKVFELMKPLINSLFEIHKSGIIHRDISPDNIMVTKEGNIKLIDFGAARDFADSGNRSLSVMLKPGYAPEEQYRSRGIQGPWTDIYALCATIYKAITGITPVESCERLHKDDLKKPSELGIDITNQQETVLMNGMAILQEKRLQNISEILASLNMIQDQEVKIHCSKCGQEMTDNAVFCFLCGFKVDGDKATVNKSFINTKKTRLKNTKSLLRIFLLIPIGIFAAISIYFMTRSSTVNSTNILNTSDVNSIYFNTPEDAVDYFLKCIQENDFEKAITTFSIDDLIENNNFTKYMDVLQYYSPKYMMAPEYSEYIIFNKYHLAEKAAKDVMLFIYSFSYGNDFEAARSIEDKDSAQAIYELLNPEKVKNIKLVRLDYALPDLQNSELNQKNIKRMCGIYGCSDTKDYIALYELDGNYYYGGFLFIKYDKGWKINALHSSLCGTPTTGAVTTTDMEEYLSLLE